MAETLRITLPGVATDTSLPMLPAEIPDAGATGVVHRYRSTNVSGGDGATVPVWADLVGNLDLAPIGYSATAPTLATDGGTKVVRFDGVSSGLMAPTQSNIRTFVIIAKCGNPPANGFVVNFGDYIFNRDNSNGLIEFFVAGGSDKPWMPTSATTGWHIITMTLDGANTSFHFDGVANSGSAPGAPVAGSASELILGRMAGKLQKIDVAEILVWDRVLSSGEQSAVRAARRAEYTGLAIPA